MYINAGEGGGGSETIFRRGTSLTESMRINSSGNVGIGTTNPGSKLTVNGSFSGDTGFFANALTLASDLRLQNNITILNKVQSSYISFATRNTSGSEVVMDLTNVGSINGGAAGPYLPVANPTFTGTITGPTATFTGGTSASATPLTLGSSTQTSFTLQQFQTSSHNTNNAYFIAYGGSHASQAGNFAMKNTLAGKNIFFEVAGATRLILDSSTATFAGNVDVNGTQITVGTSSSIFAENNLRFKSAGAAFIDHNTVSQSIKFRLSNSSSLDVTPLEITPSYLSSTVDMYFGDNDKIRLGAGSDLQIYHDGSNSFIDETGTGSLVLKTGALLVRNPSDASMIDAFSGGAVNLYYNGVKKFETTSAGVTVTGDITFGDSHFIGDDTDDNLLIQSSANENVIINSPDDDVLIRTAGTTRLQITNTLATFSGGLTIPNYINHTGNTNTRFGFAATDTFHIDTNGSLRFDVNNNGMKLGNGNARVTTILDEDNMASNSATALATQQSIKAYVDNSISGGANYLGVWNPDDSLNNGYGNPSLQASTRTDDSGDYFICSADGAAHPNGGTTEPDSWHVGDWVIWNEDLGSSGLWQKIDNTTVLSGGGTANKVAKFTDSETIGDGPITFSTNDSTFAGAVGVGVNAGSNAKLEVVSTTGEVFRADSSGGAFRLVVDQTGVNTQRCFSSYW